MTMEATAWAIDQQAGSAERKLLLLALSDGYVAANQKLPDYEWIARFTEIPQDRIDGVLDELEQQNLVRVTRPFRGEATFSMNLVTQEDRWMETHA